MGEELRAKALDQIDSKFLIEISHRLQAIASNGLQFSTTVFDKERYEEIREIAAELLCSVVPINLDSVRLIFEENSGYQTPKLSTRAAIFNSNDEILLVKDYDGKWVMPGGWCDYDQTIRSNTVKEVLEEAGLDVVPKRLIALHNHKTRNNPDSFFECIHCFVLCDLLGGSFTKNIETSESRYFSTDDLPELNEHKNTVEEIQMCLKAHRSEDWNTIFD